MDMGVTDPGLEAWLLRSFVGATPVFEAAVAQIRRYARSRAPILIIGETGTGKELAAHAAHYLSDRSEAAFIPINCGALPEALIESELFGHARGAFTDASRARAGLIREAEGGTLFLDEIESLSPRGQVVLLRFLQDASYRTLGEERSRLADVRVIAASNIDLHRLSERGEFRADLLFRLDVLSIKLPPLRERTADIRLLVPHLLTKAARSDGGDVKSVSPAALELLCAHPWPGNVRELEHVLLRAHLLSTGLTVDIADLLQCSTTMTFEPPRHLTMDGSDLRAEKVRAVGEVERRFVERALAHTKGNISEAARICNMERAAFSKMAKKYRRDTSSSLD
jgi:DNA-binding NtrC family response regulator